MFKVLSFVFLFIFSFSLYAQDNFTVVAVGDADQEKENLIFTNLAGSSSSDLKKILEIIESDFKFYKHRFNVLKEENTDVEKVLSKYDQGYLLSWLYNNEERSLSYKIYDLKDKKVMASGVSPLQFGNLLRRSAHQLSNTLYKKIVGKDSIFNSKIVFVSDIHSKAGEQNKELFIMDFDGERKERLTYKNSMIISPSISPDNTKILYSVIESRFKMGKNGKPQKIKNLNLYELNLLSKKTTELSSRVGINSGAIYDHSGENIYLTLTTSGNADIYKMNLKSKSLFKITNHFSDDVDPSINKEGNLMTFLSGRSGRAMIYTMNPKGVEKDVKRISYVGKYNAAPRFSPEGDEIVFSSWVDNAFDLYKISSNGTNLVRLTKNFGSNEEANFSPDGEFIVFTSQKVISSKKAIQNVYIMNREGEIIRQLTENFGKTFSPRWSN